jgi:5-methylcytosine-specific restriction endonuclease McrA
MTSARKRLDDRAFAVLRPQVLERDGWMCQGPTRGVPGSDCSLELEVHHILPRGRMGRSEMTNLITLCRVHHSWVESNRARAYELGLLERSAS